MWLPSDCASRYALYGALFGACFPAGSIIFLYATGVVESSGILAAISQAHAQQPLLYVIDTAPIFLGWFASLIGKNQDRIIAINLGLQQQVAEKTESLRAALDESLQANATIARMADHDTLTGLFNRRRFQEEAKRWLDYGQRHGRGAACLFFDLDDFKSVNDAYGHDAGDAALVTGAKLLTDVLRTSDIVARWGGDEFIALLPETSGEQAARLAERLISTITAVRIRFKDHEFGLSVSIGIALFPDQARDAAELINLADTAMYQAKKSGANRWIAYTPSVADVAPHN